MKLENKKILVVGKETFAYPLYYLSLEWMKNNQVSAYFFNPSESQYNKCLLNDTTYYKFRESGIPVFTSNHIAEEFTENLSNPRVNMELVSQYEKKYSHYKNFNQQILSTQFFTSHYHYRKYMHPTTYEQQIYWLQLNYQNVENILDEFAPDVVIDDDSAELARCVLTEVCFARKIPYLTIDYPRYEMYKTVSFQGGYGVDPYFIDAYNKALSMSDDELKEEISYIKEFRERATVLSKEFAGNVTSSYDGLKTVDVIKRMIGHTMYFYDQDYKCGNHRLKASNPILYPNGWEYTKFYWNYYKRKNKLMKKNSFFSDPIAGEKYVYMPLHLIPESSTFVKAPFYINELSIIEAVSKALPVGWKLYVKEHQSMIGERGTDFYQQVNRLPNARMVQINYYRDPKPWIENAMGVVTITGTAAYEAALLGKKSLVFGDVMFGVIDGITKVDSVEDLPRLIKSFSNDKSEDNIKSCAAYIKAVKSTGVSVNMIMLLNSGLPYLRYDKQPDAAYIEELNHLKSLYDLACQNIETWTALSS